MSIKTGHDGEVRLSCRCGTRRVSDDGFSLVAHGPSGLAHRKSVGYPYSAPAHCSVAFLHAPFLHAFFNEIRLKRSFDFVRHQFAHDELIQMVHQLDRCCVRGTDSTHAVAPTGCANYHVLVVLCQVSLTKKKMALEFVIEIK